MQTLVAKYQGQTEHKTKKYLESCLGGILFIDEYIHLGSDRKDSFSTIVIDTLNEFLSLHGNEFICIIAGYKEDIKNRILSMNSSLKRKFYI